jgi:hypothetical protein
MWLSKTANEADIKDVGENLTFLISSTIKLMNSILSGKKVMIFNVNSLQEVPFEKIEDVHLFCLKLFTYPFRIRYSNTIE